MSLQRSTMTTRHDDKTAKSRKKLSDRVTAYRLVDIRDGRKCRACGARATEHHHLLGRVGKDAETTGNICLLCMTCHDLRHAKRVLVITGNADSVLEFSMGDRTWQG